jgi:hypothetical protein
MYLMGTDLAPSPAIGTALVQRVQNPGLSCAGPRELCGCNGLALYESGLNLDQWGPMEWIVTGLGLFALWSMFSSTKRGVQRVQKGVRRRSAKARRKRELQEELQGL